MLYDNHGRPINYLRLAVTDRCNLRCFYCMPEEGIDYLPRKELLTYEEMERVIRLMVGMGIDKVRITGGEPFLRKGMMEFLERLLQIEGLKKLNITTNGTLTAGLVPKLKAIGVTSVNLSLDSLDPQRFFEITRRDSFDTVMQTFHELLENDMPTKINAVVMSGRNIEDLIPMVELAKEHPVGVRFIEEMPFNGSGDDGRPAPLGLPQILEHIRSHFPDIQKLKDRRNGTSFNYQIPGFKVRSASLLPTPVSFAAYTTASRLTPQGMLKTCLYDDSVFNLKNLIEKEAPMST
ncbi:MAG: radical SAM protein [Saprospiraceae bacterium]